MSNLKKYLDSLSEADLQKQRAKALRKAWEWQAKNKRSLMDRFTEKYKKNKNGCWIWTSSRHGSKNKEYGSFWFDGKRRIATHISLFLYRKKEYLKLKTRVMYACHSCHTKLCVNPNHLYVATQKKNIRDSYRDGMIPKKKAKKYCHNGHKMDKENTYIPPKNIVFFRGCIKCRRENGKRHRARQAIQQVETLVSGGKSE